MSFPGSTFGLARHEDTFLTLAETSEERRFTMPFRKTFLYDGAYLSDYHAGLSKRLHSNGMIDIGVEGWLLPADAQKLYEMAYCIRSDILELGSYRGLSATVMNQACGDSEQRSVIVSIDLDAAFVEEARRQVLNMPGGDRTHFFVDEASNSVRNLSRAKRSFGFAFIDHSHQYEHVFDTCTQLHRVIRIGGFALFHDFNDPRNAADDDLDYGVYQGVMDGLRLDRWEFWGIFGCTGLFRRIGPC